MISYGSCDVSRVNDAVFIASFDVRIKTNSYLDLHNELNQSSQSNICILKNVFHPVE